MESRREEPKRSIHLITQIMNPQYSKMREGFYKYHRLAMDQFENDQNAARKIITEIIRSTQQMNRIIPNSVFLGVFFSAKVNEITNIYKKAPTNEKMQILKILELVDPVNMDKYNKMKGK